MIKKPYKFFSLLLIFVLSIPLVSCKKNENKKIKIIEQENKDNIKTEKKIDKKDYIKTELLNKDNEDLKADITKNITKNENLSSDSSESKKEPVKAYTKVVFGSSNLIRIANLIGFNQAYILAAPENSKKYIKNKENIFFFKNLTTDCDLIKEKEPMLIINESGSAENMEILDTYKDLKLMVVTFDGNFENNKKEIINFATSLNISIDDNFFYTLSNEDLKFIKKLKN